MKTSEIRFFKDSILLEIKETDNANGEVMFILDKHIDPNFMCFGFQVIGCIEAKIVKMNTIHFFRDGDAVNIYESKDKTLIFVDLAKALYSYIINSYYQSFKTFHFTQETQNGRYCNLLTNLVFKNVIKEQLKFNLINGLGVYMFTKPSKMERSKDKTVPNVLKVDSETIANVQPHLPTKESGNKLKPTSLAFQDESNNEACDSTSKQSPHMQIKVDNYGGKVGEEDISNGDPTQNNINEKDISEKDKIAATVKDSTSNNDASSVDDKASEDDSSAEGDISSEDDTSSEEGSKQSLNNTINSKQCKEKDDKSKQMSIWKLTDDAQLQIKLDKYVNIANSLETTLSSIRAYLEMKGLLEVTNNAFHVGEEMFMEWLKATLKYYGYPEIILFFKDYKSGKNINKKYIGANLKERIQSIMDKLKRMDKRTQSSFSAAISGHWTLAKGSTIENILGCKSAVDARFAQLIVTYNETPARNNTAMRKLLIERYDSFLGGLFSNSEEYERNKKSILCRGSGRHLLSKNEKKAETDIKSNNDESNSVSTVAEDDLNLLNSYVSYANKTEGNEKDCDDKVNDSVKSVIKVDDNINNSLGTNLQEGSSVNVKEKFETLAKEIQTCDGDFIYRWCLDYVEKTVPEKKILQSKIIKEKRLFSAMNEFDMMKMEKLENASSESTSEASYYGLRWKNNSCALDSVNSCLIFIYKQYKDPVLKKLFLNKMKPSLRIIFRLQDVETSDEYGPEGALRTLYDQHVLTNRTRGVYTSVENVLEDFFVSPANSIDIELYKECKLCGATKVFHLNFFNNYLVHSLVDSSVQVGLNKSLSFNPEKFYVNDKSIICNCDKVNIWTRETKMKEPPLFITYPVFDVEKKSCTLPPEAVIDKIVKVLDYEYELASGIYCSIDHFVDVISVEGIYYFYDGMHQNGKFSKTDWLSLKREVSYQEVQNIQEFSPSRRKSSRNDGGKILFKLHTIYYALRNKEA